MSVDLQDLINLYRLPTGRRLFALTHVQARAQEAKAADVVALASTALDIDRETLSLEARWRRSRKTAEGRRVLAVQHDNAVDRALGGLYTQLGAFVHAFGSEGPGAVAQLVLNRAFPEGAQGLTSMRFEAQLAAVDQLLTQLRGDLAPQVSELGLTTFVDHLERSNERFRQSLAEETSREVSFDQVREARARGQAALLRVVAKVVGTYYDATPEHVTARQQLLGPILSQNDRVRATLAERRGLTDIDPETGEEAEPEAP